MSGEQANNLASHYYRQGFRSLKVLTEIFVGCICYVIIAKCTTD
jgi:hypothetical protein